MNLKRKSSTQESHQIFDYPPEKKIDLNATITLEYDKTKKFKRDDSDLTKVETYNIIDKIKSESTINFQPKSEDLIYRWSTDKMSINIEVGSLLECNVDCIVNFGLYKNLSLNFSVLSRSIAQKVGADLEKIISLKKEILYIPDELIYQQIITGNHKKTNPSLLFDNIIHCYLENYNYTTDVSERIYKNYLKKFLI